MNNGAVFLSGAILMLVTVILFVIALNWYLNKKVSYTNSFNKKTLIVYYSQSSHTEEIAKMIKQYLNCDIERIVSEEYENINAVELNNLVTMQIKNDYNPQVNKIDISDYDVIFTGSPVWRDDIALPVKSFLINNNFDKKTIIPFYTFGGFVDKSKLDNQIQKLSRNAKVLPSFLTIYCKFAFMKFRLVRWLNEINLD